MAKAGKLFEETSHPQQMYEPTALPIIPLSKKKASKDDTPLEKEIRRFNRLIKQLHEIEQENARQEEYDQTYDRLYQQQLVPELARLAQVKYRFVVHIHYFFQQGKFTKPQQKHFVDLVLTLMQDVGEFVPEAGELKREYLNRQVMLMNKKEKEHLSNLMKSEGYVFDHSEQFDVKDLWEESKKRAEENFFQEHESFFHHQKESHLQNKKAAQEHKDINALYKEMVKALHPDLERDEDIRIQKEHLMKELVQARQQQDLHALLVIKSKMQQFFSPADTPQDNQPYSLDQLKRYNKELKKKLDEHKANFTQNLFNDIALAFQGIGSGIGRHKNPEEEIKLQVKEIKAHIKAFEQDIKSVQTRDDILGIIEAHREYLKNNY